MKGETKWLCENAKDLENYSGQWVMFDTKKGLVSKGQTLEAVMKAARGKSASRNFVLHVPSKEELHSPVPNVK